MYIDEFESVSTNQDDYVRRLVWTQQLSKARKWFNFKAHINVIKQWRVTFEGLSGQTVWSDLALDDLLLTPGKCPPSKTCDFEGIENNQLVFISISIIF